MRTAVKPFAAVYSLLPQYDRQEIEKALSVVPGAIGKASPERLAAACREYIEGKTPVPRRNGLTETEWDSVIACLREETRKRLRMRQRNRAGVNLGDVRVFQAQQKRIADLERTVESLLSYIVECDLPRRDWT